MSFRPYLPVLALTLFGCGDVAGSSSPTTPTLVAVSPSEFSGDVPCANVPGAMRSYVVTLFDLGTNEEPSAPFALPSSVVRDGSVFRPTPCEKTAAFAFVVAGHRYDAEVDAYDRKDLVAVGPGSRHLMGEAAGDYVPPRWTTTCGRKASGSPADGPVTAAQYLTRFVHGCLPLSSDLPDTPTGVSVSLEDALGDLVCGDAPGEVNSFEVALSGSTEPAKTAACGETIEFLDLTPGESYFFDVTAYESGLTDPTWMTACFRTALSGALANAACDPLSKIPDTAAP